MSSGTVNTLFACPQDGSAVRASDNGQGCAVQRLQSSLPSPSGCRIIIVRLRGMQGTTSASESVFGDGRPWPIQRTFVQQIQQVLLSGAPGFVLLAISFAIGAYIRQVYVAASEVYDKIIGGDLKLWPRTESFTEDRLKNIEFVRFALRWITHGMFLFILLVSVRLLLLAVKPVMKSHWFTDGLFHRVDLFLMGYLTIAFALMWITHAVGSWKELKYHERMYKYWTENRFPQSNPDALLEVLAQVSRSLDQFAAGRRS
jgi:hypothetical protein